MMNVITNNSIQCAVALTALMNVFDPEIGLSVVDLGLIYQIDFDPEGGKLYATMTLTTQFCPMGESITTQVAQALQHAFPHLEPVVSLTFNPPWSHSRISEEGQAYLNR